MRLSQSSKIELLSIQKYYEDVHSHFTAWRVRYSHLEELFSAEPYQLFLSIHSNNIHASKARLEEIMDLTDVRAEKIDCIFHIIEFEKMICEFSSKEQFLEYCRIGMNLDPENPFFLRSSGV